jgi:hypothetical protein
MADMMFCTFFNPGRPINVKMPQVLLNLKNEGHLNFEKKYWQFNIEGRPVDWY